jgi:hypothetical protein
MKINVSAVVAYHDGARNRRAAEKDSFEVVLQLDAPIFVEDAERVVATARARQKRVLPFECEFNQRLLAVGHVELRSLLKSNRGDADLGVTAQTVKGAAHSGPNF